MDEISTQLRAVVAEAPPTRIDVDGLIRSEQRRRRHRTWLLTGTTAAAAVAALLVVPALAAAPGPAPTVAGPPSAGPSTAATSPLCAGVTPSPTGPQPPLQTYGTVRARPTEAPDAAVGRLTGALRDALRTRMPAGVRVEPAERGCTEPQFQYHPSYREYTVDAIVRRGGGSGFFRFQVSPTGTDLARPDCQQAYNSSDCEITRFPDGSAAVLSKSEEAPGARQLWVHLLRPDGTSVAVVTNNYRTEVVSNRAKITPTADEPLLTMDQLVTLARSPGLTLYP